MTLELGRINAISKTGKEPFHDNGHLLGFDLLGFWQWSASDLISNATRGRLAEFIVAKALDIGTDGIRDEWGAFDLLTPSGIKVEVKSAAYLQSWKQAKLSPIIFIVPRTRAFDPDTNILSAEIKRQSDVYVFALLAHTDKTTLDPLNVNQWQFYVLPTKKLDERTRSQHSITLKSLESETGGPIPYHQLKSVVQYASS